MNTKPNLRKGSWIQPIERRAARTGILLLLLTLPAVVQAQFTYTTNNGAITITGYTGPGGAVIIPSSTNGLPVTSIGNGAFSGCSSLTNVSIPSSVTNIGDRVFSYCMSLTAITVDAMNSVYSNMGGVLFNKNQTTLIQCPNGRAGSYTIPDSVTSIEDYAFQYCESLTNVDTPNSVTNIGYAAFCYCFGLTSLTIPSSVTSIPDYAFFECKSLTSVTIPDSVTSIGEAAFEWCTVLTRVTIGNSVTNIGTAAFALTPLSNVTIGNSVASIGNYAFQTCNRLTSITIPNSVTSIGKGAFWGCSSLTSATIGNSVTGIGYEAFWACSLTSVTIPSSVTNIGNSAFLDCATLTTITVNESNCVYSSVDGVLFNKNQTMLIECPNGKAGSYTIPNSVTSIEPGAFWDCNRLTSVIIPDSVTSIGDHAFYECISLTSITIGNSVTSLGSYAFFYCTNLTGVTIPNSVTSIGYEAFWHCTCLASVTIGYSVTNIGDCAFEYCSTLAGVHFNGNALSLGGSSVFTGDNNATIYYLPGTTGWSSTFGGRPTVRWNRPTILTIPQDQTAEAGSTVGLWADATGSWPLFYVWCRDDTNLISCSTNCDLELTNVQFSQTGSYTLVVSNALGAVTSAPIMLNMIAAVERRPVPGIKLTGESGWLLNVDYANSLSHAPNWTTLGSASLISTSQYYFDLTLPLPAQRYYRAWKTGVAGVVPPLDLHMVPAITLTGNIGGSVRLDYINQFGAIDAWFTLDTVTLTNTWQLYFDVSAWRQPQRLYRLVPLP